MILAEPLGPERRQTRQPFAQRRAPFEFDAVTLAIIEADGFDARETRQRPGEAGRGILPAGKKHERG